MTSVVQELFPNTPDRCIDCPGLIEAATSLVMKFAIVASTAVEEGNPSFPTDLDEELLHDASGLSDNSFYESATTEAVCSLAKLRKIAKELSDNCGGVIELSLGESEIDTMRTCRSTSEIAAFIPSSYTHE